MNRTIQYVMHLANPIIYNGIVYYDMGPYASEEEAIDDKKKLEEACNMKLTSTIDELHRIDELTPFE